ncbi:MAG: hypothetical protein LUH13_05030 [Oscillospiraceae bacterium]|nr:hypothetical protein [Oscillospiraceae bacterium]
MKKTAVRAEQKEGHRRSFFPKGAQKRGAAALPENGVEKSALRSGEKP